MSKGGIVGLPCRRHREEIFWGGDLPSEPDVPSHVEAERLVQMATVQMVFHAFSTPTPAIWPEHVNTFARPCDACVSVRAMG